MSSMDKFQNEELKQKMIDFVKANYKNAKPILDLGVWDKCFTVYSDGKLMLWFTYDKNNIIGTTGAITEDYIK
ncbi:MAG: hypothetical protein ACFFDN_04960 [Candidatus Hodarchaeota archaeon]